MSSSFAERSSVLLGLLLLTTQFSSTTAFALAWPFRSSECSTLENTPGWEAAHAFHLKCNNYHQQFFKPTDNVAREMNIHPWYSEIISRIYEENPKYRSMNITEAEVFARAMAGDADFRCNILELTCHRKFTPRQIIGHLADMHPQWEPQKLMEEAQKVSLTLDKFEIVHRLHYITWKLLTIIQTNAGQLAGTIIRFFTYQKNSHTAPLCEEQEKVLGFGVTLFQNLIYYFWPFVPLPKGVEDPSIEKNSFTGASSLFSSVVDAVRLGIDNGLAKAELNVTDTWSAGKMDGTGDVPLENSYATGFCGAIGGDFEPQNWENQGIMEKYILDTFIGLRGDAEQISRTIMMGDWTGETPHNMSLVAQYFAQPDLFQLSERLGHDLNSIEKKVTTYLSQSLESSALVRSKCHLNCKRTPDKKRPEEKCNPKGWWNRDSRFCPADDEHVICQLQCLTSQDKANHLRKPPGIEMAQEWHNITQQGIAKASWQNRNRNLANPNEDPIRGLISHGILGFDKEINSDVAPYFLPVSISEYSSLTEWDDSLLVAPGRENLNRQLPCISGDWTSSGTVDFMKRLQLGTKGKDFTSGMGKDWIEQACPRNLQALPPATHYFATCELGIQYPKQEFLLRPGNDYYYRMSNGANEHCGALLKEARGQMTEGQGNYFFCKESPIAKIVMKAELNFGGLVIEPVEELPWVGQGHQWRCKHWMGLYEKEWKEAGVRTSADVRRLEDAGQSFPMKKN